MSGAYESCVIDDQGRCKRWSHDHSRAPSVALTGFYEKGPRVLGLSDLFPPDGHRYLDADQLDAVRTLSRSAEEVTIPGRLLGALLCDLLNADAELLTAKDR